MDLNSRSVLSIGLEPGVLMRVLPLLWQGPFDVSTPATPILALRAIDRRPFRLVLSAFPLAGLSFGDVMDRLRAPDSPCRGSALLVIAAPGFIAEARLYLGRGVGRVVAKAAPDAELEGAVGELLEVAPRTKRALTLDLKVGQSAAERRLITRTVNVSRSGMLVRAGGELPVGAPVGFSLQLPSGLEVHGEGEIVRRTDPQRERIDGFGVRFTLIQGRGSGLLRHYLANAIEADATTGVEG
jgi:hypothetical protein